MKIKNLKKSRAKRAFSPQHLPLPPPPTPNLKPRAPRTPDLLSSSFVPTMRIRSTISRLLGSAYSTLVAPPPVLLAPPPNLEPCPAPLISQDLGGFSNPATTLEGPCNLSRSPWDLLDDLSLSNPQVSIFLSYHIFLLSPTSTPVLVVLCVKFMFSQACYY